MTEREHCEEAARMSFPSATAWEHKCLVALLMSERSAATTQLRARAEAVIVAFDTNPNALFVAIDRLAAELES